MFNKEIYIIAEVGSNHLGNKKIAKESLFQAKRAGADCVKFQLFDENNLVSKNLKTYKLIQLQKEFLLSARNHLLKIQNRKVMSLEIWCS